jgi:hypothetical protein
LRTRKQIVGIQARKAEKKVKKESRERKSEEADSGKRVLTYQVNITPH